MTFCAVAGYRQTQSRPAAWIPRGNAGFLSLIYISQNFTIKTYGPKLKPVKINK